MPCPSPTKMPALKVASRCSVFPDRKSSLGELKLSASDLPMLSCHYIQKGCLLPLPSPSLSLIPHLTSALSSTLSLFPPLAGRLSTDSHGHLHISCNDAGVLFLHVVAPSYFISHLLSPPDLPPSFAHFFAFDRKVSYSGHFSPLLAVQVTELADGIFIGCSVNHAVADGTSFWHFFNTFAQLSRGLTAISNPPDFRRDSVLISKAVLPLPEGGPTVTFNANAPLRQRIFSFSRQAIQMLKAEANAIINNNNNADVAELMGKHSNDPSHQKQRSASVEISSFQSLCGLLWRAVTRARNMPASKKTTFRMAVNCRHRLEPKLGERYFGNAIQSIATCAMAGEVVSRELRWCAEQLSRNVKAHNDATVRRYVKEWESSPRCFPLGNPDGASITMGSSPRFPMYENDFGWGRPLAVRSGAANKFDGKISAFPAAQGPGAVDLEVVLDPHTMAALESDAEFMRYASPFLF